MHEFSVAQSIVDTVLVEAEKNKAKRVTEIVVEIGELMQLDLKALKYSLRILLQVPMLKDAKLRTQLTRASFSCKKCGDRWRMQEARRQLTKVSDGLLVREPDSEELPLHFLPHLYSAFIRCPRCGSSDLELTKGKEIQLARIQME